MSDIILTDTPKSHNAQLGTKIYFWFNPRTEHIMQGAPPQFDAMMPYGYERITCNHAAEAETWSKRLSDQDKRIHEMSDYEQELFEGPMRADLRKEIVRKMQNPSPGGDERRKRLNYMLLERALQLLDEREASGKTIRESYLHAEGFEAGK